MVQSLLEDFVLRAAGRNNNHKQQQRADSHSLQLFLEHSCWLFFIELAPNICVYFLEIFGETLRSLLTIGL